MRYERKCRTLLRPVRCLGFWNLSHTLWGWTYRLREEPATWNITSALMERRFLNMGSRQDQGPRVCYHYCGPPAAKNSHSRLNSQSFLCVSVSHDHRRVWAHKLNMQHLQKENLFQFSDQDFISDMMWLFIGVHEPFRDHVAFFLVYWVLRPSTQPRLINWLCHTQITHLAQDLFLLSNWQQTEHTRTQFDYVTLVAFRSSSTSNP